MRIARWLCIAVVVAIAVTFPVRPSFCGEPPPLPDDAKADLIIVEKARHTLTLIRDGKPLRRYAVSLGTGGLAKKTEEGDNRTPEGTYSIDGRNPNSAFHLSLHVSYPNDQDTAIATKHGKKPGGNIMIHGIGNGLRILGAKVGGRDALSGQPLLG